MAYQPSLAQQASARIFKVVRQKAYSATLATIEKAAKDVMKKLDSYRKYHHVTGNTWTSTTIGIYYKGRLVSLFNKGAEDEEPTRVTLKKGERYNKTYYYKGGLIGGDSAPYVGIYGQGGQWGPSLGPWFMHRQHSPKYKTWNMVVAIPVSYAGFNPKIIATLQAVMDDLPNTVSYNVVRVEDAPSQSVIDFGDAPF